MLISTDFSNWKSFHKLEKFSDFSFRNGLSSVQKLNFETKSVPLKANSISGDKLIFETGTLTSHRTAFQFNIIWTVPDSACSTTALVGLNELESIGFTLSSSTRLSENGTQPLECENGVPKAWSSESSCDGFASLFEICRYDVTILVVSL